jgi:hypothetical protein
MKSVICETYAPAGMRGDHFCKCHGAHKASKCPHVIRQSAFRRFFFTLKDALVNYISIESQQKSAPTWASAIAFIILIPVIPIVCILLACVLVFYLSIGAFVAEEELSKKVKKHLC